MRWLPVGYSDSAALNKLSLLVVCLLSCFVAVAKGDKNDSPRELQVIDETGDSGAQSFVHANMEPRHAVAVLVVGKGSKRHKLLEAIARDEVLADLLVFGVQFIKGSSLTMFLHGGKAEKYEGKWTHTAIYTWLKDSSYPLVNRMANQFAPHKYLSRTPYGTVLIVQHLHLQTDQLAKNLEAYALRYRDRLKFTFFTKTTGTQKLCEAYGVLTNDELLIFEEPAKVPRTRYHSNVPGKPKYRLENVTPARLERFFAEYAAGTRPQYYMSGRVHNVRSSPLVVSGIRELTAWDFHEVVNDPAHAVLVSFVSKDCSSCDQFGGSYREVARRVEANKALSSVLIVARIDQSSNEHSEFIKGTPWLRFWPPGRKKATMDPKLGTVDEMLDFLEEKLLDDMDSHSVQSSQRGKDRIPQAPTATDSEKKEHVVKTAGCLKESALYCYSFNSECPFGTANLRTSKDACSEALKDMKLKGASDEISDISYARFPAGCFAHGDDADEPHFNKAGSANSTATHIRVICSKMNNDKSRSQDADPDVCHANSSGSCDANSVVKAEVVAERNSTVEGQQEINEMELTIRLDIPDPSDATGYLSTEDDPGTLIYDELSVHSYS